RGPARRSSRRTVPRCATFRSSGAGLRTVDDTSRCPWCSPGTPRPGGGTAAFTACRCSTTGRRRCTGRSTNTARTTTGRRRRGGRLGGAGAIGAGPALVFAAAAPLPDDLEELFLAGFVRREPVSMVKGVTVDVEVPAGAEIVLEGYVDPGERRREGPFGDHTG